MLLSSRDTGVTHFVPVTMCVTQKVRGHLRLYGVTHYVTGTKCVTCGPKICCLTHYVTGTLCVMGAAWPLDSRYTDESK